MNDSKKYPTFPERFPEGFMNVGGKTFQWVLENKQEFVDFTINEMNKPTGLFRQWKQYCMKYSKKQNDGSSRASDVGKP